MGDSRITPEAAAVAEHFHEVYDRLYPRNGGNVSWEDMPESYRARLCSTFAWMTRDGSIQPGPGLAFHQRDPLTL